MEEQRHEINKKLLCKKLDFGGLNMFNLKEFEHSLKKAWIPKLIQNVKDWSEFANDLKK